jgi:hypothetical protein
VSSIHSLGLLGMAPISNFAAGWSGHAFGPLASCAGAGIVMICVVAAAWSFTGVNRLE